MRRALACLAAVVLLAACNGGDDKPKASPSVSVTSEPPVALATAKPKVVLPTGPAPDKMTTKDLVIGTGAHLFPGQVASVHYVGVLLRDGTEFDSSWEGGHPFQFRVGDGDVIEGWDKGLLGMKVGGRRELVIPPGEAYGADPTSPLQNETLVFVIDLIAVGGPVGPGGEETP